MKPQHKPIQAGETVLVTVRTHDGKPHKAYPALQVIQAVYEDGSVRTCTGDIWNVTRTDKGLLAIA